MLAVIHELEHILTRKLWCRKQLCDAAAVFFGLKFTNNGTTS